MKLVLRQLLLSSLVFISKAHAYETMIRYKYGNCMTCHYSHTGSGLLGPYGKVIAGQVSTFSSSKNPQSKSWDNGLQARFARFEANATDPRHFPMQLDYLSAFRRGKTSFEGVLSKTPKPKNTPSPHLEDQFHIKKALVTYSPSKKIHFQLGRDFLDTGLNLVDHTLMVRSHNKRSVTDFFSVGRMIYYTDTYKLAPYFFFPSFQENYEHKEKGAGIKAEKHFPAHRTSLAFSQLIGDTSNLTRKESSLSFKTGLKNLVFLGEASFTHRQLKPSKTKFDQNAYLFSTHLFPVESLELKIDVEKLFVSSPFPRRAVRSNHAVLWKPIRNLSLQYHAKRNIDRKDQFQSIWQIYFNGSFL